MAHAVSSWSSGLWLSCDALGLGFSTRAALPGDMGNVCRHFWIVTTWGRGAAGVSRLKPGIWLDHLQCTGQTHNEVSGPGASSGVGEKTCPSVTKAEIGRGGETDSEEEVY